MSPDGHHCGPDLVPGATDIIRLPPEILSLYGFTSCRGANIFSLAENSLCCSDTLPALARCLPLLREFPRCVGVLVLFLETIGFKRMAIPELMPLIAESVYVLVEYSFLVVDTIGA